jgi:hypothetical protein
MRSGSGQGAGDSPTFRVLTNAGVSRGDIFAADFGPPSGYGTGPEILSTTGKVI